MKTILVIALAAVTVACSNGLPHRPLDRGGHGLGGLAYGGFDQHRPHGGARHHGKRSAEEEPLEAAKEVSDLVSSEDVGDNEDGSVHSISTRSAEPQHGHGGFGGQSFGHGGHGGFEGHGHGGFEGHGHGGFEGHGHGGFEGHGHGGFEGHGHGGFGHGFEGHGHGHGGFEGHGHGHHHHHHHFDKRSADAEPHHTFGDFLEDVFLGHHHHDHDHHHDDYHHHHDDYFHDDYHGHGHHHHHYFKRSADVEPEEQAAKVKPEVESVDNKAGLLPAQKGDGENSQAHLISTRAAEPQIHFHGHHHHDDFHDHHHHHHEDYHHGHHHHHHHHHHFKRSADAQPHHTFGDFLEDVADGVGHAFGLPHHHHHDYHHHDHHHDHYGHYRH